MGECEGSGFGEREFALIGQIGQLKYIGAALGFLFGQVLATEIELFLGGGSYLGMFGVERYSILDHLGAELAADQLIINLLNISGKNR